MARYKLVETQVCVCGDEYTVNGNESLLNQKLILKLVLFYTEKNIINRIVEEKMQQIGIFFSS